MSERPLYLDNAATTAVDPAVIEAMTACLGSDGSFENPSSAHPGGASARRLVEAARERIAERVNASRGSVVFTSGATESNNLAILGAFDADERPNRHFVTTRIEHHSVLDTARALEARGIAVTYLDCNAEGVVTPQQVLDAVTDATVLVSIMHVNNEIGVIQDIEAIAQICATRQVRLHVDAAQSAGKIPLDLGGWGVDLCSLTAHKAHGPKGIGALYVADDVVLTPQLHGGEQERGLRAGTLATHQIVGMGKTFELARPDRDGPRLANLRDRLWKGLERIDGVRLNGCADRAAPHILNVCFPGIDGESLRLALADIAVSAGSACASDIPEPSHVLSSLGLSDALAQSSLRLSVGRFTEPADTERAVERIGTEVARLRTLAAGAPAWCSN